MNEEAFSAVVLQGEYAHVTVGEEKRDRKLAQSSEPLICCK
jgi:hypothetical protein